MTVVLCFSQGILSALRACARDCVKSCMEDLDIRGRIPRITITPFQPRKIKFGEPRFLVTLKDKAGRLRRVKVSKVDNAFINGVMMQGFKILDVRQFSESDFSTKNFPDCETVMNKSKCLPNTFVSKKPNPDTLLTLCKTDTSKGKLVLQRICKR